MNDHLPPEVTAPHLPAAEPSGDTTHPRDPAPDETRPPDPAPSVDAPAAPGGRYRFGAELARGGMGVVYLADDLALGREVAIKVIGADLGGTDAARRFVYEARVTGQLQHPSIPPVHDLGTLPDGRPFLAMKRIRGRTLADELKARPFAPDDFDHCADVFEKICMAVAFAHSKGIIHRDLKPSNVMVGALAKFR